MIHNTKKNSTLNLANSQESYNFVFFGTTVPS